MVKVDIKKCIGCGACAAICPEGFEMNKDGKAQIKNKDAKCIAEAMAICPIEAITK